MDGAIRYAERSSEVATFVYLKYVGCYTTIASTFLILYDSFITFGQEVELVWHSPWSTPKFVYFINRYSSIAFALLYLLTVFSDERTSARCMAIYQLSAWYSWANNLLVQLIVQIWLYAIFNRNRQLLFGMGAASVILGIVTCSAIALSMARLRVISIEPVCIATQDDVMGSTLRDSVEAMSVSRVPPFILATLLPSMALSLFMLGLLAYKVMITFNPRPSESRPNNLAMVLMRDSVVYCSVIFVVGICNALLVTIAPTNLVQAGLGFGIALPSIASSRILLNLRNVDKKRERQTDVHGLCLDQWETMFHIT